MPSVSVSLNDALDILRKNLPLCAAQIQKSAQTLGRVLAQDVLSPWDMPAHDTARMDGYAVRIEEFNLGVDLKVVGQIGAGEIWKGVLGPLEALRIATGGILPNGANGVAPNERVKTTGKGSIRGEGCLRKWDHVARCGAFAKKGARLLTRGSRLDADALGLLASIGLGDVKVARRPRVRIVLTGSELIDPNGSMRMGHSFASHGWYLRARVEEEGGLARVIGPIPDDLQRLCESMGQLASADFGITTGGTGKGQRDLIARVMAELNAEVLFQGVHMRPGGTISLYRVGRVPVLCLPGGTGAVKVGFELFGRFALNVMQGAVHEAPGSMECVCAEQCERDPLVTRFLEACIWSRGGRLHATTLSRKAGAEDPWRRFGQGWMEIPYGNGAVIPGSVVRVLPKRGDISSILVPPWGEGGARFA